MSKERFGAGLAVRREVLGAGYVERALAGADSFDRDFQERATEFRWGGTLAHGVPARRPVVAAAAALTVPVTSGPSKVSGIQAGSMPSASTISGDQSRAARSKSNVPAPSALSSA